MDLAASSCSTRDGFSMAFSLPSFFISEDVSLEGVHRYKGTPECLDNFFAGITARAQPYPTGASIHWHVNKPSALGYMMEIMYNEYDILYLT